ncbi:MAG TPA: hypothetical protein VK569_06655, partial [Bacteroidota bacterium]|nr:hypothetical protein [Bacteroidota bacterium]
MPGRSLISRIIDLLVRRISSGLKIPEPALRMFQTANELSGLDRKTLPTELIPLNTIQLARGLLNFTLLQSLEGWVLPYWAERQYDPADAGFIPRSHLGLSINITRRNWTAVGSPSCNVEPVVDPRGAVMPLRNRWTSECWLKSGGGVSFPSRAGSVRQMLRDGLPIVTTSYDSGTIRLDQTVSVDGSRLMQEITLLNTGTAPEECSLAFAIRPFNPEGACLLRDIRFEASDSSFVMDGTERFMLPGPPDSVHCSNHAGGDCAAFFAGGGETSGGSSHASCDAGLAHGYAAYGMSLAPRESRSFRAVVDLEPGRGGNEPGNGDPLRAESAWRSLLAGGTEITTPEGGINEIIRASLSTLLLLTDGDSITPGPWTYHQFWFRDAAVMLRALDAFGFHSQARAVIRSFPSMQESSGFFRSQQGEWDSNGQALWTVWQHVLLSGECAFGPDMFDALGKGALWIARKRRGEGNQDAAEGLMPAGLSAEHLGLADRYFWDNWWSLAGLDAYARLCRLTGRRQEEEQARRELDQYREDIERSVAAVRER